MPRSRKAPAAETETSCIIHVHVVPRSSRISVETLGELQYKVRLTSPPVEGAANKQLVDVVAEYLSLPRRQIEIVAGETARHKRLRIHGAGAETVRKRLQS